MLLAMAGAAVLISGEVHSGAELALEAALVLVALAAAALLAWFLRGNYLGWLMAAWTLGLGARAAMLAAQPAAGFRAQGWALAGLLVLTLAWAAAPRSAGRRSPGPAWSPPGERRGRGPAGGDRAFPGLLPAARAARARRRTARTGRQQFRPGEPRLAAELAGVGPQPQSRAPREGHSRSHPGRLELAVERFGGREGRLFLVDLERPAGHGAQRRGERLVFRERFRQLLARSLRARRLAEVSSEPNLQHSLSPSFPRALLTKGQRALAAIAAPEAGDAPAS